MADDLTQDVTQDIATNQRAPLRFYLAALAHATTKPCATNCWPACAPRARWTQSS